MEVNFRRSVIIAELWRPEVAIPGNFVSKFLRFFEKNDPFVKIFKIMFQTFSPPHLSTLLCSNFVKCCRREIGEIVSYLLDQNNNKNKISAASQTVATTLLCRSRPKSAGASPQQVLTMLTNRFTFSGVIAECVNTFFYTVE